MQYENYQRLRGFPVRPIIRSWLAGIIFLIFIGFGGVHVYLTADCVPLCFCGLIEFGGVNVCLAAPVSNTPNNSSTTTTTTTTTNNNNNNNNNILLVTIDTLRADHLGCYGYKGIKTPHIDALAREGILFQQAYTPVPVTFPSHVSILTGTYPPFHGVRNNGNFTLNNQAVTLAEILSDQGYQTAAFVGAYVLDSFYGLDQGFDYYDDDFSEGKTNDELLFQEKRAEQVVNSALRWLEKDRKEPFFIWLHCFDPHAPYSPPPPFLDEYNKQPYDGEIAYTDHCLGKLFQRLQDMDIYNKTTIIVTSDHGESLGEHEESTHGIFIYEATLQIPFIIKSSSLTNSPQTVQSLIRTIDLVPSILEMLHINYTGPIHGQSFLNLVNKQPEKEERILYCESYLPYYNHGWSPLTGLRQGDWKYIKAPKPELYNLKEDHEEKKNQIKDREEIKNKLEEEFKKLLPAISSKESRQPEIVSPNQAEKLMSLGYLITAPSDKKINEGSLDDPKDKIGLLRYLDQGLGHLEAGDPNQAILAFRTLLDQDGENIFAHLILGSTYCQKTLYDLALEEFKKVARMDEAYMDIHSRMAFIYEKKGLTDQAIEEYKLAIQKYPKCSENYNLLAKVYIDIGKYDEAITQLKEAVKLKPKFTLAHNNLGLAYGRRRNYALSLEEFQIALEDKPDLADIYNNLGCVYLELGILLKEKENLPQMPIPKDELDSIYTRIPQLRDHPEAAFDLAKEAFEEAIKIDKGKESRVNLGITYLNMGLIDKAINEYQKIIREDPNDIGARSNLVAVYLQAGLVDKAIANAQEILKIDPANMVGHYYLGSAYLKSGQTDQAILEYSQIVKIQPQNPDAHFYLGEAYRISGKVKQAIEEYKRTLEINPQHYRARQALSLLSDSSSSSP